MLDGKLRDQLWRDWVMSTMFDDIWDTIGNKVRVPLELVLLDIYYRIQLNLKDDCEDI